MTRLTTVLPFALLLASCGGFKTVDAEALAEVDADAMGPIMAEQRDLADAEAELERLSERQDELKSLVRDARYDAKRAEVDVEGTREAKVTAVRAGDASSVEELDDTIAAAEGVYEAKQARADRLEQEQIVVEKELEAAEVHVELAQAEIELARVEAAQASGADVDVEPFQRQVDDLQQDYAEALDEVEAVRVPADS